MTNTDLVTRFIDCWNTGNLNDIDALLAPNFIRHEAQMGGGTTGRNELKQTIIHYRSVLSEFHTEAVDVIEQGDKLAFRFKTTGKRGNAPFIFEGVNIFRIEGHKFVENWVYFDATAVRSVLARAQTA